MKIRIRFIDARGNDLKEAEVNCVVPPMTIEFRGKEFFYGGSRDGCVYYQEIPEISDAGTQTSQNP